MGEIQVVADYGDLCGEGPLWDHARGTLYWIDATGQRFYSYHPASSRHEILKEGLEIYGFAFHHSRGFVLTNTSGIWLWDHQKEPILVASEVDGVKCQMNDCIADPEGRLFAGSFYYDPAGSYPLGYLMRIDPDHTVRIVDEGIHLANGLGFSPDEKTLYFTDSVARTIYAYDYEPKAGQIKNRRVFVKVSGEEGIPDGLTVDAEGFVWSAQWYGSCVVRYDAAGKEERRIQIPAKQVSSLAFGGESLTDLFITSAGKSEPMPVMPPGYDPTTGPMGGQLFRMHLDIQGKPEYKAKL